MSNFIFSSFARRVASASVVVLLAGACARPVTSAPRPVTSSGPAAAPLAYAVIPNPASIELSRTDSFVVTPNTGIYVGADASPEVEAIGTYAANMVASHAGVTARRLAAGQSPPDSSISLVLDPSRSSLGAEGYELTTTRTQVRVVAAQPAGLFYGVQTIRQLLPPSVEHQAAIARRLAMPTGHVVDSPRFVWRGAMLDVARHFLPATDVKRFIDVMALYKLNRLHLHLADDQGFRIEIKSWPRLTEVGGPTAIGGAPGGFYTQAEYADLVAFARSRYITIVPEIDMPGHSNSALVSYPGLSCNGVAPPIFTAVGGPPNSLCVERDSVYTFVSDVVREIAAAAPTPYFHIGGDEVRNLSKDQYRAFVEHVERIVDSAGPTMIGWGEISIANIRPNTIVQHWDKDSTVLQVARGGKVIMSPSAHAYLDMKYDSASVLGLRWAGLIDLKTAYDWNPATDIPGVGEQSVLGVEAPLWAETLLTLDDYEFQAFPRLIAFAELGWSPATRLGWEDFRRRIGANGARLAAMGVNFARVPGVNWTW